MPFDCSSSCSLLFYYFFLGSSINLRVSKKFCTMFTRQITIFTFTTGSPITPTNIQKRKACTSKSGILEMFSSWYMLSLKPKGVKGV